jgi:hypothetical protein
MSKNLGNEVSANLAQTVPSSNGLSGIPELAAKVTEVPLPGSRAACRIASHDVDGTSVSLTGRGGRRTQRRGRRRIG